MHLTRTIAHLLPVLVAVDAGVIRDSRSEAHVTPSSPVGGPHGTLFDDKQLIGTNHRRISEVKMDGGCERGKIARVSQLQLTYRDAHVEGDKVSISHGTTKGQTPATGILLNLDEYITQVEIAAFKADVGNFGFSSWTRIGWIKFTTNQQKTLECGAIFGSEKKIVLGAKDQALLYFTGRDGDMLDELTAHWIDKAAF